MDRPAGEQEGRGKDPGPPAMAGVREAEGHDDRDDDDREGRHRTLPDPAHSSGRCPLVNLTSTSCGNSMARGPMQGACAGRTKRPELRLVPWALGATCRGAAGRDLPSPAFRIGIFTGRRSLRRVGYNDQPMSRGPRSFLRRPCVCSQCARSTQLPGAPLQDNLATRLEHHGECSAALAIFCEIVIIRSALLQPRNSAC